MYRSSIKTVIHTRLQSMLSALNKVTFKDQAGLESAFEATFNAQLVSKDKPHNTSATRYILEVDNHRVFAKLEFGKGSAMTREVAWYQKAQQSDLINVVTPDVIAMIQAPNWAVVMMDFLENFVSLDELIVSGSLKAEVLKPLMWQLLDAESMIYKSQPEFAGVGKMVEHDYTTKLARRLKAASRYKYLQTLFENDEIIVNGIRYRSIAWYNDYIMSHSSLRKLLVPSATGFIHGDLHFGNILSNTLQVRFVDPRQAEALPLAYDFGKLLHSVYGLYGPIMRGKYTITQHNDNAFDLDILQYETYATALSYLEKTLTEIEFLQGLYVSALHFATMLSHHARQKQETTVLFLRAIQTFRELFFRLGAPV